MEKISFCPPLSPNNFATTNPSQLLADQDHLDKLSNQLKLLKIDDLTINKILKKFKPIKNEVKVESTDCQILEPQQQQPFVGYDGLFEFAISQVIDCGYGHVLPTKFFGTNKRKLKFNINLKQPKQHLKSKINTDRRIELENAKLMVEQLKLVNKISKNTDLFSNEILTQMLVNSNNYVQGFTSGVQMCNKKNFDFWKIVFDAQTPLWIIV